MVSQLTTDGDALRLFFTDDIYLIHESVSAEFKFLGNNERNILILVNDDQNQVSDGKGRELLRKIVKSVNLTAVDFALLNYAGYAGTSFRQLINYFSSNIIFAFGVHPKQLGLSDYPQNTVVIADGVKLIFSSSLTDLDEDPNGKKTLWGGLKQLGL